MEEGIYRVNGIVGEIRRLKSAFDECKYLIREKWTFDDRFWVEPPGKLFLPQNFLIPVIRISLLRSNRCQHSDYGKRFVVKNKSVSFYNLSKNETFNALSCSNMKQKVMYNDEIEDTND